VERIVNDEGPPVLLLKGEFEFSDDPSLLEREVKASGAKVVTFGGDPARSRTKRRCRVEARRRWLVLRQ
jgi:hypothetical protein